jgi:hypothetical protein
MENQFEIWKDVVGYEGIYQVSSFGGVKRLSRKVNHCNGKQWLLNEKQLKQSFDFDGYLHLSLTKDKIRKNYFVHRLIAISFIPNSENKIQVNHIDGCKSNNFISNLEWATLSENRQHAYRTGLQKGAIGNKQKSSKLNNEKVLEIRAIGKNKTLLELSKIYNVKFQTISKVLNRNTWKHI